jgi:hypothetical protein
MRKSRRPFSVCVAGYPRSLLREFRAEARRYLRQGEFEHTRAGLCYHLSEALIHRGELGELPVQYGMGELSAMVYATVSWLMRANLVPRDPDAVRGYLCAVDGWTPQRRLLAEYLEAVLDLHLMGATDQEIEEWVP